MTLTTEIRKGEMIIIIDGKKQHFKTELIDMKESLQVDFKGLDFGTT